jgi:hypothetical protein
LAKTSLLLRKTSVWAQELNFRVEGLVFETGWIYCGFFPGHFPSLASDSHYELFPILVQIPREVTDSI